MSIAAYPHTSFSGTILSSQVMANFDHVRDYITNNMVELSGNQSIAGVKTFSSVPVLSAGLTVSANGITVTGNSTITGTLTALTGVTSSGTAAFATLTASGAATISGLLTASAALTVTTGNLTMSAGQAIGKRIDGGDSGASKTVDFDTGQIHRFKLTGNCTFTFNNMRTGATYYLELMQDATGSRTITMPASVVYGSAGAPTLTTTASRKDILMLYYNGLKAVCSVVEFGVNDGDTA